MLYFAYGSNMATARLQQRIPSAMRVGVAHVTGYRFSFRVASTMDGSAKCDLLHTGQEADRALGVLFRIDPVAKPVLDGYEGIGVEYRDAMVEVVLDDGSPMAALVYLGTNIDDGLQPYRWYREHVLRGALENALPQDYIEMIRAVPVQEDPDPARTARELSIYG